MIAKFGSFEYALAERYLFEDELGRGAMGTVYLAKDVRLGRPVAIKMLHAMLTNELGISRFKSEIHIAAGLHHPNIIGVHESGEVDGRLYYVMDYLGGESLRARLEREKQLPVEEAIHIAEEVAAGLQCAHDRGVVHRDVKPENIILAEGRACIVDFGLALALSGIDEKRLTASGLSVGTPHYLSPEQASAEKVIGPRADQYALACVVYEMIIGEPPFTGPTGASIAMRHITETPQAMRSRRKSTTPGIEHAVARAMEKVPADRFATITDFVKACRADARMTPSGAVKVPAARRSRAGVIVGVATAAVVVAVTSILVVRDGPAADAIDGTFRSLTGRTLDTMRVMVAPFASADSTRAPFDVSARVGDAIANWNEFSVASAADVRAQLTVQATSGALAAGARAAARSLGAGRYVTGTVATENGVLRINAQLRSAASQRPERVATILLPLNEAHPDSLFAHLVYELLYQGPDAAANESAARGTRSNVAFNAYLKGKAALRTWRLTSADSLFTASLALDADFPQASLALAKVRAWARDANGDVVRLTTRALDRVKALSTTDRMHAAALNDLASGRWAAACVRYDSLIARDSLDFAAWYGSGECNLRDEVVVANGKSPSGYSFRGSQQRAVVAIDRAFDLLPAIDECCMARAATVIRSYYKFTVNSNIRRGFTAGATPLVYAAYPEFTADTLSFNPYPLQLLRARPVPATRLLAVRQQRSRFLNVAAKRVALAPKNADALELLAEAMELVGDPTAVDTLRKARRLAGSTEQARRFGVSEVWLRVKYAVPSNLAALRDARVLAESLLVNAQAARGADAESLTGIAALIGDADLAALLSERTEPHSVESELPPEVLGSATAFLVRAALGGPLDSLVALSHRVITGIANGVLPQHQARMRAMWLDRGAALAFPVYHAFAFEQPDTNFALIRAELAFSRGERIMAIERLRSIEQRRANIPAALLTLDALYPEAWLASALGERDDALRRIVPTLDALRSVPTQNLSNGVVAGSLIQSMMLRAQLHAQLGDRRSAVEWARAVRALTDTTRRSALQLRRTAIDLAR